MSAAPSFANTATFSRTANATQDSLLRDGKVRFDMPLKLACGRMLDNAVLAYRLVGDASKPVVAVMGGISAGRCFWSPQRPEGWWQYQFGPGRAGDTDRFCFLSFDFLGGEGGSSNPENWGGSAAGFPQIDTEDQANALALLLEHLGIDRLHSIVGASYGGMVALQFAAHHSARIARALVLCGGHQPSPLATGWRHVQRQVLEFGISGGDPESGVRIARALAMCTYRSEREFQHRFPPAGPHQGSPASYLDHCGAAFAERFNVYAYLCLSQSIDDHRVDPSLITTPLSLVGFTTDQIVPPQQLISLRGRLAGDSSLKLLDSPFGHDAFLKERGAVFSIIRKHLEAQG